MPKGRPADLLDPASLIEHAERLITSERGDRPLTVDAPRAASAAYYAAYHAATGAVAGLLFGDNWLHGVRWFSHKSVIDASRLVTKYGPADSRDPGLEPDQVRNPAAWSIFQECNGAGSDLLDIMEALRSLQVERNIADYDRTRDVQRATARELVALARAVADFFGSPRIEDSDTKTFLALVALKS